MCEEAMHLIRNLPLQNLAVPFGVLAIVIAIHLIISLIWFLVVLLSHFFGQKEDRLSVRLKKFGMQLLPLWICLAYTIYCALALLLMALFGLWGLFAGIPILIIMLAVTMKIRFAIMANKQYMGHTEVITDMQCDCGNELRLILGIKYSQKTVPLYYNCYVCKKQVPIGETQC